MSVKEFLKKLRVGAKTKTEGKGIKVTGSSQDFNKKGSVVWEERGLVKDFVEQQKGKADDF